MKNEQQPAYPIIGFDNDGANYPKSYLGLSKLEEFTKAAMQGLCANSVFNSPVGADQTPEGVVAQIAVSIARATLSELQKQQP